MVFKIKIFTELVLTVDSVTPSIVSGTQQSTFAITISNNNNAATTATDVEFTLTDTPSGRFTFISSVDLGTCTLSGCTGVGDIAAMTSVSGVFVVESVASPAEGDVSFTFLPSSDDGAGSKQRISM